MTAKGEYPNKTEKLKVLHIISHYELGGAETCTFELSKLFNGRITMAIAAVLGDNCSKVGKHLTKIAKKNGTLIFPGTRVPWKYAGFLMAAFQLRRIILDFKPDIIHLNTEIPEFSYAICLTINPSFKNIPVIRTIHNTELWSQWKRLGAWCERKLNDNSVIYVSNTVQQCFNQWRKTCLLPPVNHNTIIYNAIILPNHTRHKKTSDRPRQDKEIKLLFAGRFEKQKGCDLLPEIVKLIKVPENTQLTLSIFGEGSGENTLLTLKDNLPQNWQIKISPPLLDLVDTLPDFDLLLFPSRFEGYGRVAAEAVLMNVPVVAFQLPVLMEIFPADYPWLSPFNDKDLTNYANKVSTLLASIDTVQPIVNNAKERLSERLNPEKIALAYLNFYKKVHKSQSHATHSYD